VKNITPIETRYRGYRFRSRLEARWAVFFDALEVPYEYEPQGYYLEELNVYYLPDFWLPEHSLWVEVKPDPTWNRLAHDQMLALCGRDCTWFGTIVGSLPKRSATESMWDEDIYEVCPPSNIALYFLGGFDVPYYWCCCPKCGCVGFEWRGYADRNRCGCYPAGKVRMPTADWPPIVEAYNAARSARFEHGEAGAG
jgi:hypothetical protein